MRSHVLLSHVLLRLVGGKELWKSMRAASSLCLENMVLIIDTFICVRRPACDYKFSDHENKQN